ncbi:MAG: hypothetical protein CME68_04760 [Halobacteriovoraceae bacterium]|nr:hypothetical protein [Halobacteriovoraceae bacterium]
MKLFDQKPIVACSSGVESKCAISLLRLSGFEDISSLNKYFDRSLKAIVPRKSYLVNIVDKGKVLDQALLTFFKGQKSYTGENTAELSIHGNPINVKRILKLFTSDGFFRLAEPGEFTYRALKNQKLTLSQVEGLDSLLNANSEAVFSQGLSILRGDLHASYIKLLKLYTSLKSSIELMIDFSEDVGEETAYNNFLDSFCHFFDHLEKLHARTRVNLSGLLSPSIVLIGKTNAGKSTVFNLMLNTQRSIISSTPGTTRDYISEYIDIKGVNYKLIDTAGLRKTDDNIEAQGIDLAIDVYKKSFFKVLVINPHIEFDLPTEVSEIDFIIFSHCELEGSADLCSKIILEAGLEGTPGILIGLKEDGSMGPLEKFKFFGPIGPKKLSVGPIGPKEESHIREAISYFEGSIALKYEELMQTDPIVVERHSEVIRSAFLYASEFKSIHLNNEDVGILSSEINILGEKVSELIGVVNPDSVLNNVFMNFCIGK